MFIYPASEAAGHAGSTAGKADAARSGRARGTCQNREGDNGCQAKFDHFSFLQNVGLRSFQKSGEGLHGRTARSWRRYVGPGQRRDQSENPWRTDVAGNGRGALLHRCLVSIQGRAAGRAIRPAVLSRGVSCITTRPVETCQFSFAVRENSPVSRIKATTASIGAKTEEMRGWSIFNMPSIYI